MDAKSQWLRHFLNITPDIIYFADLDGRLRYWNTAFEKFCGLSEDELKGRSCVDFVAEHEKPAVSKNISQLLSTGTYASVLHFIKKDGSSVPFHCNGIKIFNDMGEPEGFAGLGRDISEHIQAEKLEKQFGKLLRSSFNEIYIFDAEHLNFVQVSDGAQQNLGYSFEELKHLSPLDLKPLFTRESFEQMVVPLRVGREEMLIFETIHKRKNGSTYPIEVRLQLLRNSQGMFLAIVQDITERKKSEAERASLTQQLINVQKMESLGHLAGGVAHDFNNVLSAIIGYADLIKVANSSSAIFQENINKYANNILSACNRSKELISQIKLFSQAEKGEESEDLEVVHLQPVINEVIQLLRSSIPTTIDITYGMPANEIYSNIAPIKLHQILINLVLNAKDAIQKFGVIDITMDSATFHGKCSSCCKDFSGEFIQLAVSDNGIGIPDHVMNKIFDPFFSTKISSMGCGMGLSIVHGLVHSIGGHTVVSSEDGKGTTFNILLPAVATS